MQFGCVVTEGLARIRRTSSLLDSDDATHSKAKKRLLDQARVSMRLKCRASGLGSTPDRSAPGRLHSILRFRSTGWTAQGSSSLTFAPASSVHRVVTDVNLETARDNLDQPTAQVGPTLGYVLIALHAMAAPLHHDLMRDNTLVRMLPGHGP